jgi:hypothetical protein
VLGSNAPNRASTVLYYLDYIYAPPLCVFSTSSRGPRSQLTQPDKTICHVLAGTIVVAILIYILRLVEDPRNLLLAIQGRPLW